MHDLGGRVQQPRRHVADIAAVVEVNSTERSVVTFPVVRKPNASRSLSTSAGVAAAVSAVIWTEPVPSPEMVPMSVEPSLNAPELSVNPEEPSRTS